MRVLLDECLPRRLGRALLGHEVTTVAEAGWAGIENGELIRLAATRFEVLLTIDQRFAEGQPIPSEVAVITLAAKSNRVESLQPLVPELLRALVAGAKGRRTRVGG